MSFVCNSVFCVAINLGKIRPLRHLMNTRITHSITLLIFCFCSAFALFSQNIIVRDTVTMGANYTNDVFYTLKNPKNKTSIANSNYHLSFSNMISQDDRFYSIWINDNNTEVYVNPTQKAGEWDNFDTNYVDNWRKLQNTDSSWGKGGFSTGVEQHPRYTWAVYTNNGELVGDSLYLVVIKDENHTITQRYKLRIVQRKSTSGDREWTFKYGALDNSWDTTITLNDLAKSQGNFMYFDMMNHKEVVREPNTKDWDLLFTAYMDYQEVEKFYYPVKGVLQNYKIRSKVVEHLKLKDVTFMDWADTSNYSRKINTIGYEWKNYNRDSFKFILADSNVYFIAKAMDNGMEEVYAIQFVSFAGAKSGEIVFDMARLGFITSTEKNIEQTSINCYPNPAKTLLNIELEENANLSLFNVLDTELFKTILTKGNNQIDIAHLENGIYLLNISANNKTYKSIKVLKH